MAPADVAGGGWREALFGIVRREFRSEILFPSSESVLFGRGPCRVRDCQRGGFVPAQWHDVDGYLCYAHDRVWDKAGRPGSAWLDTAGPLEIGRSKPCIVEVCARSAVYGGRLCRAHASRWTRREDRHIDMHEWSAIQDSVRTGKSECVVDGCDFPGTTGRPLCDFHSNRSRAQSLSPAEFRIYEAERQLRERRHIDLRPLTPIMRLELQYALQVRHDDAELPLQYTVNGFISRLAALGPDSLMDRDVEWLISAAEGGEGGQKTAFSHFLAQILRTLHLFRDEVAGIDEWERNVWRFDRLELDPEVVEKSRARSISFVGIEPEWLRSAYKRWTKWRLQLGSASPSTVNQSAGMLRQFSAHLLDTNSVPPRPEDLTRDHLIGYLAHTNGANCAASTKHQRISAVRHFLDEVSALGWLELSREARYYPREIPQQRTSNPRFVPEHVMTQMETTAAMERIPDEAMRTLMMLLMETGLRGKDARFLSIDSVVRGKNGQPYLQYVNNKSKRELVIPISDQLDVELAAQRRRVRERFPETCKWLFPSPKSRQGKEVISSGLINKHLTWWLAGLELKDENNEPATVTAHQFRHTVGTRMINDGVPLVAIQQFLGHSSSEMTLVYAQMHDATLREHVTKYHQRINRRGELVELDDGPLSDAAWMSEHFSRAKQALPDGYCGRPLVQACPHPNACKTCDHFLTDASFLPVHRAQLTEIDKMILQAEDKGWERMAEVNKQDKLSLVAMIEGLEKLEVEGEPSGA